MSNLENYGTLISAELEFLPPHSVRAHVWGYTGALTSFWEDLLK